MKRVYRDKRTTVYHGDAARLDKLADASIDAIVCDPPYGLEFMGKDWDAPWKTGDGLRRSRNPADVDRDTAFGRASRTSPEYFAGTGFQAWSEVWAAEALRVLKPGGYLVAFGGTRTWHRLACAIEDAGFEIRDSIAWMYGNGFPKSLDMSKAIDKAAGATRKGKAGKVGRVGVLQHSGSGRAQDAQAYADAYEVTGPPVTTDAKRWDGWGTALKPGHEPIILARKPLAGTVAANVLAHGTGGINIDGCRVGTAGGGTHCTNRDDAGHCLGHGNAGRSTSGETIHGAETANGRWPTNVVLSHVPTLDEHGEPDGDACADGCVVGCPVAELDGQSGTSASKRSTGRQTGKAAGTLGAFSGLPDSVARHDDSGGASRFFPTFRYQAKAPTKERVKVDGVAHPTVKPLALMRWLVRLVTPPDGTVLDPFAGSGTTVEAARLEGFRSIAIEREPSYLPLIEARIERSAA